MHHPTGGIIIRRRVKHLRRPGSDHIQLIRHIRLSDNQVPLLRVFESDQRLKDGVGLQLQLVEQTFALLLVQIPLFDDLNGRFVQNFFLNSRVVDIYTIVEHLNRIRAVFILDTAD